jgi:transcription termination factor Rho
MRGFAVSLERKPTFMTATELQTATPRRAIEPGASVPVSGLIDSGDGHALVRISGYRPGPSDVYVSAGQLKQYGLRKGDQIAGTARPSASGRAKYRPLVSVDTVNGVAPELARARPHFDDLTPLYPQQRLRLEDGNPSDTARIIDLVAPIGKGQRGLIVSPPK